MIITEYSPSIRKELTHQICPHLGDAQQKVVGRGHASKVVLVIAHIVANHGVEDQCRRVRLIALQANKQTKINKQSQRIKR